MNSIKIYNFHCDFIYMKKVFLYILFILFLPRSVLAQQWPLIEDGLYKNPSDPSRPYSNVSLSGSVFNLVEGQLWQYALTGDVAFGNYRNLLTFQVPIVRSVIPGIENFSGIGDINGGYSFVFYERKTIDNPLINATASLNISLPTGNADLGEGVGRTVFVPGLTLAFKPVDQVGIYPSIQYITSSKPATGRWAGGFPGAVPDETGTNPEARISAIQINSEFNLEFNQTWLGLTPVFSYDFTGRQYTVNLRPEVGRLFNDSFLLKINSTFYILGQRHLLYWTRFVAAYYF